MPLTAAIRLLLEDLVAPSGIATHLDDRLSEEPGAEARTVVYRIVREALINVRQHAHPDSVVIAIETHDGGIQVTIEDNGAGFDPVAEFEAPAGHLGLPVMRERAQMTGGWLRTDSAVGQGTTISFWVPSLPKPSGPE